MEFRILGPVEARRDDHLLPLRGAKQRALLALLLLNANESLSRDQIVDALWGERPPATWAKALQVYVSQLRKLLEPDRPPGVPSRVLVSAASGYRIQLEHDQLDLHRFERLVSKGREALAGGDATTAGRLLEEALALWRGPPLAELAYEPFAQTEIARLEEVRLAALEDRIEADLRLGRHAAVVAELEVLVQEHPLRESLRGRLMLALYRSGRQAEALDAYQQGRRALVEELGIEPTSELRGLQKAILCHDPALAPGSAPKAGPENGPRGVLVGRERELDELHNGLEQALLGHGGLYLLVGEPGIGKSRLADELVRTASERGAHVLVGRCWEAGGAPAYWPWVQALRAGVSDRDPERLRATLGGGAADVAQLVPELRELLPLLPEPPSTEGEGARFRLFEAVTSFLKATAEERPHVLVLDDLHAADEPSLLLLQFLARDLAVSRLLVVGAYRDVDPTVSDALAATLAEVRREPTTHGIVLRGLAESAVAEYIELDGHTATRPLVGAIHAETEGNPLFVGEVVRLLAAEGGFEAENLDRLAVPEGISQVIGRRLHRLTADCYRALTLASVLGREFDVEALQRVGGMESDRVLELLDEAMRARVVSELPDVLGRVRFEHGLIRDTVYESLTRARRAQLHRRVGEALEDLYAGAVGPHLAELAHHFFAALPGGDREKAVAYATRAAERAVDQLAFEEAARLYEMALTLVDDDVERCELQLELGDAHARAGNTPASKRAFSAAAQLADMHRLPDQLGRAAFGYGGRILWQASRDDDQLVSLIEQALAAIGDEESTLRVLLLARLAGGPLRDSRFPPELKRARAEEAVEIARRIGDPATLAYALAGYTQAYLAPDQHSVLVTASEECVAAALAAGDQERVVEGYEQLFLHQLGLGDAAAARASLDELVKRVRELGQPPQFWLAAVDQALLALLEGRFADAERLLGETVEYADFAPRWNTSIAYQLQLYLLRRAQGRLAEVVETVETIPEDLDYRTYPIIDCVRARLYAGLGRDADAHVIFERLAAEDFAGLPFDEEWLVSVGFLAELVRSFGDQPHAAVLYEQLSPYADQVAVAYPEISTGSVSRYLGLLAGTLSRWDEAENHFDEALAVNEQIGARPWLAETQDDYAATLMARNRRGDAERALELLQSARVLYEKLGMLAHADRAQSVLGAAGAGRA